MPNECFQHPRLAAIYDPLDPDRSDLDAYVDLAAEFTAHRVLDIGCGTGVFALLLAHRGIDVAGVDPALASSTSPVPSPVRNASTGSTATRRPCRPSGSTSRR